MPITYDDQYHGKPILTDKSKQQGFDTKILKKIESVLNHVTEQHNKNICVRMDVRYPENHTVQKDNKDMQKFMAKHVRYGRRHGYDPQYIWVREQSEEKNPHYHLALFYDGKKVQHPQKLISKAEEHWGQTIGVDANGLVDHCTNPRSGENQTNHYRLRRNDDDYEQVTRDCFQRLSNFAKTNTKRTCPKRIREVSTSRMPKD